MFQERLHFALFDGPILAAPTGEAVRFPTKKSAALLAYLVEHAGEDVPREVLADLLWPTAQEEQARGSLRQELGVIRKMLTPWDVSPIEADRNSVTLPRTVELSVDTWRFANDPAGQLDLYEGAFLGRLRIRSDAFDRWCLYARQSYQEMALDAAHAQLTTASTPKDQETAATRLLDIEPGAEEAHQTLMRLYHAAGKRELALQQFDMCEAALAARLDIAPSRKTLDLREAVLSNRAVPDAAQAAPVGQTAPSRHERRDITVLVLGLAGDQLDQLDPEDFDELAGPMAGFAAQAAADFNGHLIQNEGCSATICFGIPSTAEFDADTAVMAAESFRQTVDTHLHTRASVTAGISCGKVLASRSETGGDLVGVQGAVQRQATTLQARAAPGQIACDPALATQFSPAIAYTKIDGYLDAARAGQRPPVTTAVPDLPIVGREAEVELLLRQYAQVTVGQGQALLLEGPPGIGKSRLVQALLDRVQPSETQVFILQGDPHATGTAMKPILALIESQLARDDVALAPFLHKLNLSDTEPLLRTMLYAQSAAMNDTSSEMRDRAVSLLLRLVQQAARRGPVILVCDDVQWFDPTTVQAIEMLLAELQRLPTFVLCAAREGEAPAVFRGAGMHRHQLDPLLAAGAKALVAQILPDRPDVSEVAEIVAHRAVGHPLALEEFAYALSAALAQQGVGLGRAQVNALVKDFDTPARLKAMFLNRLDRLPNVRHVIECAAVLGTSFEAQDVAALMPNEDAGLAEAWDTLVKTSILVPQGAQAFRFRHALLRDTVHETIPKSDRMHLHAKAAQHLLASAEGAPPNDRIAHHLAAAGDTQQAAASFEAAGLRATQLAAHQEAIDHFEAALEMTQKAPEDHANLTKQLALSRMIGAQMIAFRGHPTGEAEPLYLRTRNLALSLDNTEEVARTDWGLWSAALLRADFAGLPGHTQTIRDLSTQSPDSVWKPAFHFMEGVHALYTGKLDLARDTLGAGVAACRIEDQLDYERQFGMDFSLTLRSYLAWSHALLGEEAQTIEAIEQSLHRADEINHDFAQTFAHVFGATACVFLKHESAPDRIATAQFWASRGNKAIWRAQVDILAGRWASLGGDPNGLCLMQSGLSAYQKAGSVLARPYAGAWIGEALVQQGEVRAAGRVLEDTLDFTRQTGERYFDRSLTYWLEKSRTNDKSEART
ncbi:MAG: AAA family ATPase [Pseudomonadota bacterium]